MVLHLPPVPQEIKSLNHFIKIAAEHEERNIIIAYWTLMYAVQLAMKEVPGTKSPEVSKLLMAIMDWLEKTKNEHRDQDGMTNETAAAALIEEYILKLFQYAEEEESNERYHKNMIKAYYNSAIIIDILQQFAPLTEDFQEKRKFAKWRATHIHACLKVGETPIPPDTIIHLTKEDEMANGFTEEVKDDDKETDIDALGLTHIPSDPPANSSPTQPPSGSPPSLSNLPSVPEPEPSYPTHPTFNPPASFNYQPIPPAVANPGNLGPEQMEKAQKYCKWASSALNYDDVKTAVENLQKALHLLTNGTEM